MSIFYPKLFTFGALARNETVAQCERITISVIVLRDADHQSLILCPLRNRCCLSSMGQKNGVGAIGSEAKWGERGSGREGRHDRDFVGG